MTRISPGSFCENEGEWKAELPRFSPTPIRTLTLATYNIWFDPHHQAARHLAILQILKSQRPDVIALQEVTHRSLERILRQDWIRQDYTVSDFRGNTFSSYGTVTLSRIPVLGFKQTSLPSQMGRNLLTTTLEIAGRKIIIGNVHLESRKVSQPTRAQQMERIFPLLADADDAALMGDFNLCSSWKHENDLIDRSYVDCWPALHDADGYTEDTHINTMRYLKKGKHKQVRFDRILIRGNNWKPTSINLLGTESIATDLPDVFPSDHFGLVVSLDRQTTSKTT